MSAACGFAVFLAAALRNRKRRIDRCDVSDALVWNMQKDSMTPEAHVDVITEADIPDVARYLARQVRPGEAVSINPLPPVDRLRWLLLNNPARNAGIPFGWRIRSATGAVVGAATCTPWRIGAPNFATTALMFAKFFVDAPYRGMGLGIFMRFIREGRRFPLFCTSTNEIAGEMFRRVGGAVINGMDHTMLGIRGMAPLAEEYLFRRFKSPAAARILASPAHLLRARIRCKMTDGGAGELTRLMTADEVAARGVPTVGDVIAVVRDREYLHWRYFTGDRDKEVFCLRCPGESDRIVVINRVLSGYRSQIRVLNVLDIWPPATPASARSLVAKLWIQYGSAFDTIWLRSQSEEVESALQSHGWMRHAFPAPLGWYIDAGNRLPTHKWYVMPGESE